MAATRRLPSDMRAVRFRPAAEVGGCHAKPPTSARHRFGGEIALANQQELGVALELLRNRQAAGKWLEGMEMSVGFPIRGFPR